MKKISLCVMVLISIALIFGGCAVRKSNEEILNELKNEGKIVIAEIEEYSYLSDAGQIIGTYNLNENETVLFISKGKPAEANEYQIYLSLNNNEPVLIPIRKEKGEYKSTFIGIGDIFLVLDDTIVSDLAGVNGVIDFNDELNNNKVKTIGWFSDTIIRNGHIFGISTWNHALSRKTLYGQEYTELVENKCFNIQYNDEWLYYIRNDNLYRIREDGSNDTLLIKNAIDYVIDKEGVFFLSEFPDMIVVYYKPFNDEGIEETTRIYTEKGLFEFKLIGVEDNKVYLSRNDNISESVDLIQIENDIENVLMTDASAKIKPIIISGDIYYIAYKNNARGIYRYNIDSKTEILLAKHLFTQLVVY
ncbi:MAG: DUF5050 domain-containing protein [Christensenellales bacterium]